MPLHHHPGQDQLGTPGRVEEHLRKGSLSLAELNTLVLDEADCMLDMGFQAALEVILGVTPPSRQTLLFSATYAEGIRPIVERLMREPVAVKAASTHDSSSIHQHFHRVVDEPAWFEALCRLLLTYCPLPRVQRGILQHQRETREVADTLGKHGFSALTGEDGIASDPVGKIKVQERSTYVAVSRDVAKIALQKLSAGKLKGRPFRARRVI